MLRTTFVLLILIPGLAAALFSRFAALLLYVWFAMFRPLEWLWVDVSRFRPSLVIGVMLVGPCLATGVLPALAHPLALASLSFLGVNVFALLDAVRPDVGWEWLGYLARIVVVSLLIAPLAATPNRLLVVVGVLAGSFLFHSAKAGLASILRGGTTYYEGLAGAFSDNNGYAVGTAMAMFLLIAVAQSIRWRVVRWGLLAAAGPLSAMTVVSLFSRSGFLAMTAGLAAFIALQRSWRTLGLAIVLVGAAVAYLPMPTGYANRLTFITNYDTTATADESAAGRLHFWRVAVDMVKARPLGVGMSNFEHTYDFFDSSNGRYGSSRSVHNTLLQVLAESGVAGFAFYALLLIAAVIALFRVRKRAQNAALSQDLRRLYFTLSNGMLASMVAFLIGGAFISMALNDMTWLTIGAVIAIDRLSHASEQAVSEGCAPAPDAARPPTSRIDQNTAGFRATRLQPWPESST